MKKTLLFLWLVCLIGCSQESSGGVSEPKPFPIAEIKDVTTTFTSPETNQEFSIIRTDQFLQNYAEKVKSDPEQYDNYKTYAETFVEPLMELCIAEDVSKSDAYSEGIFKEKPNSGQLSELELLRDKMDEEQVTKRIKEALLHSASLLPGEEGTTVCIFPTAEESGVDYLGSAFSAGQISIYVHAGMDYGALVTTVAHEYNHSILFERFAEVADGNNLLDYMVIEGKAVLFEEIAFPDLFDQEIYEYDKSLWKEAEEHLTDQNPMAKEEIMFGSDTFPYDYGYNEGYKILFEYLDRDPEAEIEEWMAASSKEVYEGSEYASYYD